MRGHVVVSAHTASSYNLLREELISLRLYTNMRAGAKREKDIYYDMCNHNSSIERTATGAKPTSDKKITITYEKQGYAGLANGRDIRQPECYQKLAEFLEPLPHVLQVATLMHETRKLCQRSIELNTYDGTEHLVKTLK